MSRFGVVICLLVGAGCASSDTTKLPSGNASGSALSGAYMMRVETLACDGRCGSVLVGEIVVPICDIGTTDVAVTLTQADGRLELHASSPGPIGALKGGAYADGRVEIGGRRTEFGQRLEHVVYMEGVFGEPLPGEVTTRSGVRPDVNLPNCTMPIVSTFERQ